MLQENCVGKWFLFIYISLWYSKFITEDENSLKTTVFHVSNDIVWNHNVISWNWIYFYSRSFGRLSNLYPIYVSRMYHQCLVALQLVAFRAHPKAPCFMPNCLFDVRYPCTRSPDRTCFVFSYKTVAAISHRMQMFFVCDFVICVLIRF